MKKFCRILQVAMVIVLACALALPMVASAEMVKKVDNFIVFVDQSGSMGQSKFVQTLDSVTRFDKAVPELGYNSAVALFAPYKVLAKPAPFKTGAVSSAVKGIAPPYSDLTNMGDALKKVDKLVSELTGKTALILFTDGESNEGPDPIAAAKSLYSKYGENLCIHVVSFADTKPGQKIIDDIKALNGCSVVVDAKSLADDATMVQFAKAVLYDDVAPAPVVVAPAPAVVVPAPVVVVPAPIVKEVITFNLLFGFDKHQITDEMIPVLEQAKMILMEDAAASFTVAGHTDSTGPEAYNQKLSERRANSVKTWLVNNGVAASRLDTIGYGETSPKYDNGTREGRKLNRRVEIQTK